MSNVSATSIAITTTGSPESGKFPTENVVIGCAAFIAGLTIGISLTYLCRDCCKGKNNDKYKVVSSETNEQTSSKNNKNLTNQQPLSDGRSNVSAIKRKASTLDNRQSNNQRGLRRTNSEQYELARPLNSNMTSSSEGKDSTYENSNNPQNTMAQEYVKECKKKKKRKETSTPENLRNGRKKQMSINRTHSNDYEFARPNTDNSGGEPVVRFADDVVRFEKNYSTDCEFACLSDISVGGKSGNKSGVASKHEIIPLSGGSNRSRGIKADAKKNVGTHIQRTNYEMARPTGSSINLV